MDKFENLKFDPSTKLENTLKEMENSMDLDCDEDNYNSKLSINEECNSKLSIDEDSQLSINDYSKLSVDDNSPLSIDDDSKLSINEDSKLSVDENVNNKEEINSKLSIDDDGDSRSNTTTTPSNENTKNNLIITISDESNSTTRLSSSTTTNNSSDFIKTSLELQTSDMIDKIFNNINTNDKITSNNDAIYDDVMEENSNLSKLSDNSNSASILQKTSPEPPQSSSSSLSKLTPTQINIESSQILQNNFNKFHSDNIADSSNKSFSWQHLLKPIIKDENETTELLEFKNIEECCQTKEIKSKSPNYDRNNMKLNGTHNESKKMNILDRMFDDYSNDSTTNSSTTSTSTSASSQNLVIDQPELELNDENMKMDHQNNSPIDDSERSRDSNITNPKPNDIDKLNLDESTIEPSTSTESTKSTIEPSISTESTIEPSTESTKYTIEPSTESTKSTIEPSTSTESTIEPSTESTKYTIEPSTESTKSTIEPSTPTESMSLYKRKLSECENDQLNLDESTIEPSTSTKSTKSTIEPSTSTESMSLYKRKLSECENDQLNEYKRVCTTNNKNNIKDNDNRNISDTITTCSPSLNTTCTVSKTTLNSSISNATTINSTIMEYSTTQPDTTTTTTTTPTTTQLISDDNPNVNHEEEICLPSKNPELGNFPLDFKCFKCLKVDYDTLTELKEHQKTCLNREINSFHERTLILQQTASTSSIDLTSINDFLNKNSPQLPKLPHIPSINNTCTSILQPPLIEPLLVLPPAKKPRNLVPFVLEKLQSSNKQSSNKQSSNKQSSNKQSRIEEKRCNKPSTSTTKYKEKHPDILNPFENSTPSNYNNNVMKNNLYLCSPCRTYHRNWNLFLHMRNIHKRYICLYCFGMFSKAEYLTLHLEMKHDIEQNHFNSQDQLIYSAIESCFVICCTCETIFSENDKFRNHKCSDYLNKCTQLTMKKKIVNSVLCKESNKNENNEMQTLEITTNEILNSEENSDKISNSTITLSSNCTDLNPPITKEDNRNYNSKELNRNSQQIDLSEDINKHKGYINNLFNSFNKTMNTEYLKINKHNALNEREESHQQQLNINSLSDNNKIDNSNKTRQENNVNYNIKEQTGTSNSFTEPANFDCDLINLYKSNRMAISKQKQINNSNTAQNSMNLDNKFSDITWPSNHSNLCNNSVASSSHSSNSELNPATTSGQEHNFDKLNTTATTSILEKCLTMQKSNIQMETAEESKNEPKLIVPKFKLKIPKEFQQSAIIVGSEHSSTDSDTDTIELDVSPKNQHKTTVEVAAVTDDHTKVSSSVTDDIISDKLPTDGTAIVQTETNLQSNIIENTIKSCENNANIEIANNLNIENDMGFNMSDSHNDSDMDIDITCTTNNSSTTILSEQIVNTKPEEISNQPTDTTIQVDNNVVKKKPVLYRKFLTPPLPTTPVTVPKRISRSLEDLTKLFYYAPEKQTLLGVVPTTSNPPSLIVDEFGNEKLKIKSDNIEIADDDVPILELSLDEPLNQIDMVKLLRVCIKAAYPTCLYCNHARRIAVNGHSLTLHMLRLHRFSATVDSITAEELQPYTIGKKLKSFLPNMHKYYFNMNSYCNISPKKEEQQQENSNSNSVMIGQIKEEKLFECFQCRFQNPIHKELYLHNRKMHLRCAILCFMCRSNFYSYSEVLCHVCPGSQDKVVQFDMKFRCCICDLDEIPSAFRLMVHLRKKHSVCDVCLEYCHDPSRLSSHVWKHKLHHLCYRCGIAYRNKPDITKHLFWKHGTESVMCKRCLQKRWPHVYHFCTPPSLFVCEVCNMQFSKALFLKVHKRLHSGDAPYPCNEDNCDKKFISRKLLLKHVTDIHNVPNQKLIENETLLVAEPGVVTLEDEMEEKVNNDADQQHFSDANADASSNKRRGRVQSLDEKNKSINIDLEESQIENNIDDKKRDKKKKNKSKKVSAENLEDLNLQAPNLSESDSSDESDTEMAQEKINKSICNQYVPNVMLSPPSETDEDLEKDRENGKITDIWNNIQSVNYNPEEKETVEEENKLPIPNLHVVQSDHDYCEMFKLSKSEKNEENDEENKDKLDVNESKNIINKKSEISNRNNNSAKKRTKSCGSSSSSSSSSSSDSSCSCGSNCSCSTSSGSSSGSSSSSDDSDSSSSEGKRRIAAKRATKTERDLLHKVPVIENISTENIDVVTNEPEEIVQLLKPAKKEPIVVENDLETDESDTDEDFYDNHPQKLASELLAEKRRQLMLKTSLSPSHTYDIVENSRPSTPSLPEELLNLEKKQKIKKKKRERKASSKNMLPPFKLNISPQKFSVPDNSNSTTGGKKMKFLQPEIQNLFLMQSNPSTILQSNHNLLSPGNIDLLPPVNLMASSSMSSVPLHFQQPNLMPTHLMEQQNHINSLVYNHAVHASHLLHPGGNETNFTASQHATKSRLISTGSSSDADGALKRSKRARRPNRFYGYSSDDDTPPHQNSFLNMGGIMGLSSAFKPTPPPNLTWCKEDLPSPSKSILLHKNSKTSQNHAGLSKKIKIKKERPKIKKDNFGKIKKDNFGKIKKDNFGKIKKDNFGKIKKKMSEIVAKAKSLYPPIPTIKIKPLPAATVPPKTEYGVNQSKPTLYQHAPPIVTPEPVTFVPPVVIEQPFYTYIRDSSGDSSGNSSDEDKLTIPTSPYQTPKPHKKLTKSISKTPKKSKNKKLPKLLETRTNLIATESKTTSITTATSTTTTKSSAATMERPALPPAPIAPAQPPVVKREIPPALLPNPDITALQYLRRNNIRYPIRPPAGARAARDGESVYCYCRCPYDEVSEMIACDGDNCLIEWFHFECVGIFVAPQGKWFCAECKTIL